MFKHTHAASRRHWLGAAAGLSLLPLFGCASTGSGPSIGRVVVIGGGFGGATAAVTCAFGAATST